jgi:hypothetical protein
VSAPRTILARRSRSVTAERLQTVAWSSATDRG